MNSNFSLFFYGVGAKFLKWIGIIGVVASFWVLGIANSTIGFIVGLIISIGIYSLGSAMRFDYQRNSGSIIHGGDGWGR